MLTTISNTECAYMFAMCGVLCVQWSHVIFNALCTLHMYVDSSKALSMKGNMMESVYKNSQAWIELRERCRESGRTLTDKVKCFECISDAVVWTQDQMKQLEKEHSSTHSWSKQKSQPVNDQNSSVQTTNSVHFQVHVTGAHLVGGVLAQLGFTADDL